MIIPFFGASHEPHAQVYRRDRHEPNSRGSVNVNDIETMAPTVTIKEQPQPDRKLSTTFIASKIDGSLIPPMIDDEVYFNEPKDRYEEVDENTP